MASAPGGGMDSGIVTAIVGAIAAFLAAIATGLWQWLGGRRKAEADAKKSEADANASIVNGFILLLKEMKEERAALVVRLIDCERKVARLIRVMVENNVKVPEDVLDGEGKDR